MTFMSDAAIEECLSRSSRDGFDEHDEAGAWDDFFNRILVYPFHVRHLTPVGYDLTVGPWAVSLSRRLQIFLDPGAELTVGPRDTVLVLTEEYVGLPKRKHISGFIESKVSVVSRGFSHISTTVDHDWEGHLLIAVSNTRDYPLTLSRGDPFCTMTLFRNDTPARRASGKPPGRTDVMADIAMAWAAQAEDARTAARPVLWKRLIRPAVPVAILVGGIGITAIVADSVGGWGLGVAITAALSTASAPLTMLNGPIRTSETS